MNLYERVGGEAALTKVVVEFYERIASDDLLGAWFTHADGVSIRRHLVAFLVVALGGPEAYEGRSLRQAHSGLRITGTAWDRMLYHLSESIGSAGVGDALRGELIGLVTPLRAVVVAIPAS